MDADAHSAASGADTTSVSVSGARWWGPAASTASASTDVMNQLCRVCGEPAAGFHFGAFTCEGCKSFFGRTYNNTSSISECKNNGECIINKKNRTSCKACRLRKCLMVGMSKSGSRYGRRSNWFKIHCLLQEQQQQQQQQAGNSPVLREPLNSKNNKVLPLWEGLAPHFHDTKQPLHLPNVVDVDNNNSGTPKNFFDSKSRTLQPGHLMPVRTLSGTTHPGYGGADEAAAAALWAARNTLLPLQVTSHHHATSLPPLTVPFLTSPFLHGAGFHHPHHGGPPASRNFLLPFVQSVTTSPNHQGVERLASPATSSSTSSSSSCQSPSPIREGKLQKTTAEISRPEPRLKHGEESRLSNYDKSVAMLQSLGPVQDQPIDLSLRTGPHNKTVTHRRRKDLKGHNSSEENIGDQENASGSDGGVDSCDDDRGIQRDNEILKDRTGDSDSKKHVSAPLDLTTRT